MLTCNSRNKAIPTPTPSIWEARISGPTSEDHGRVPDLKPKREFERARPPLTHATPVVKQTGWVQRSNDAFTRAQVQQTYRVRFNSVRIVHAKI